MSSRRLSLLVGVVVLGSAVCLESPAFGQARTQQAPAAPGAAFKRADMDQRNLAGQASSPEEQQAWDKVSKEVDLKKRSQAAEDYLQRFPEGGFGAYAHEIIAVYARQKNDLPKFYEHGEKAVAGLPNSVALMVSLSSAYADDQKPDLAIRHGEAALKILPTMMPPLEMAPGTWPVRRDQYLSEAYYGVGTAYLFNAFNSSDAALMDKGIDYLKKSLELAPRDERTQFRLAFGYQLQGDMENAIQGYARTVVLGGANSKLARQYLEQAYTKVHGSTKDLDKLLDEQKKLVGDGN